MLISSTPFRAACVQLNTGDDLAANIEAVRLYTKKAVVAGASLVALPENAFYMGKQSMLPPEDLRVPMEQHPGVIACQELARGSGADILIGSVAVPAPDGRYYNRSIYIDQEGRIAAYYDKIHLFDATLTGGESYSESKRIAPGGKAVIADTRLCKLGMTICYDLRFPGLYRALAQGGAEVISIPAAFTGTTGRAHWHALVFARAIEAFAFVLAPGQTGTHPSGRRTFGHSLIVSPWGDVLAEAGDTPGVISAEIDLARVVECRAAIPAWNTHVAFQAP